MFGAPANWLYTLAVCIFESTVIAPLVGSVCRIRAKARRDLFSVLEL